MDTIKPMFSSFVVGGLFSILGQGLMVMFTSALGTGSGLIVPMVLLSLGIVGALLFVLGIYQKIEQIGAYGAILPFCGLCAAVAGTFLGAKNQTGSTGAGTNAAVSLILFVVGIGTILAVAVGIVAFYTI